MKYDERKMVAEDWPCHDTIPVYEEDRRFRVTTREILFKSNLKQTFLKRFPNPFEPKILLLNQSRIELDSSSSKINSRIHEFHGNRKFSRFENDKDK